MSHRKDTDFLAISARIRAMENRLLNRDRLERIIEARSDQEAVKVLVECGYPDLPGAGLEQMLAQVREETVKDLSRAVPGEPGLEIFKLKYDYHNAKTILKAEAMGVEASRLLLKGGRYEPQELLDRWQQERMGGCADPFRRAMEQAAALLKESKDPQQADLLLDKAMYAEMTQLAKDSRSAFLEGYVRILVDAANLRTAVRVYRMDKDEEFLRGVLLEGGNVSVQTVAGARGEGIADVFQSGALAEAAKLGAALIKPGSGALTAFEKACDDAVTKYVSAARRVPFGEQVVIGYLYAREAELTAVRTIFAGRAAKLDGDTIRRRLREIE
jgi:V/A-type H+-transporting ATPase subunit C